MSETVFAIAVRVLQWCWTVVICELFADSLIGLLRVSFRALLEAPESAQVVLSSLFYRHPYPPHPPGASSSSSSPASGSSDSPNCTAEVHSKRSSDVQKGEEEEARVAASARRRSDVSRPLNREEEQLGSSSDVSTPAVVAAVVRRRRKTTPTDPAAASSATTAASTTITDGNSSLSGGNSRFPFHNDATTSMAEEEEWLPLVSASVKRSAELWRSITSHVQAMTQTRRWLPLTAQAILPDSDPPLWPSQHQHHRSSVINPVAGGGGGGGGGIAASLVPTSSSSSSSFIPLLLPLSGRSRHKVCVLDLDETLLVAATSRRGIRVPPTYTEAIPTLSGAELYYVWERPHVVTFLNAVAKLYNLVLFTASTPSYADLLVDRLERKMNHRKFKRRYYRADCTPMRLLPAGDPSSVAAASGTNPSRSRESPASAASCAPPPSVANAAHRVALAKDLALLGVPLTSVVLIDNSACAAALHPTNTLLVEGYVPGRYTAGKQHQPGNHSSASSSSSSSSGGERDGDVALLGLLPVLEALYYTTDVRDVLSLRTRFPPQ